MAAPIAYEKPTLNKAWETYIVNHFPVFLFVWVVFVLVVACCIATLLLSFIGITLFGATVGGDLGSALSPSAMAVWFVKLGQIPVFVILELGCFLFAAIPAIYYSTGEIVTIEIAFRALFGRPWRYIMAGVLYVGLSSAGLLLCFLPGLIIAFVLPIYVSKIFTTDIPIFDAFISSFRAMYRHENGWTFVGIQLLSWLLVYVVALSTCGIGWFFAPAVASFYVQNAAYRQGVLT